MHPVTAAPVNSANEAHAALRPAFPETHFHTQECFLVLALDAKNRPIGQPRLTAIGSLAAVEVHPRDVFRHAITSNAMGIIVAHNHPSGDAEPSTSDRQLTQRLVEAGKLLGIPVLDHIIIAAESYVSLSMRGDL